MTFMPIEGSIDAFNVLNRVNDQVPNNIFSSPTFGRPTAANDPRQLPGDRARLIEAHGGAVWAENAPGGGAVCTFTIPKA